MEMIRHGTYNSGSLPTNFYIALVTSATAPDADTNTLGQLTEIANGNGYTTGGFSLAKDSTDFDGLTEVDARDRSRVDRKDVTWTASGGAIPGSGDPARYAVETDDNATVANREVLLYWDLGGNVTVGDEDVLTLENLREVWKDK